MIADSNTKFKAAYSLSGKLFLAIILVLGLTSCKKDESGGPLLPWYPELNDAGDPILGVFENKIPCSDCERTKVALVIYKNGQTGLPSTYTLARIYVGKGDDRLTDSGHLTITQGTQLDSSAIVYRLDANAPDDFRLFWRINEDLLFMLDSNLKPRVGDASYGYVLNRVR